MEVNQLRYVVAIAQTGSFTKASKICHVSQPSLSQQVQKLEEDLGIKIFERHPRQVKITQNGRKFLIRAKKILLEIEAARREAENSHSTPSGTIKVGVLPTIAPYFLPDFLPQYRKNFPEVHVVVHEDTTDRLIDQLSTFQLDLAIASSPFVDPRLETQTLFREELLLAMPDSHPLAFKPNIKLHSLMEENFIIMKEGHCLGNQIVDFCQNRNFQPNITCRSAQIETVQALILSGLGISLIPKMAVTHAPRPGILYRSLEAPGPSREISVIWFKNRPPGRPEEELIQSMMQAALQNEQKIS